MKIFITGESGVIPMAISLLAEKFGFEIVNTQLKETLIDGLKSFQAFKIRKPEIDFADKVLESAIFATKPDIVIHSGAYVGTEYCLDAKEEAVKTNVYGTQNVVDICNKYGIKLVYFSTTAIFSPKHYGEMKPIDEHTQIDPQTLYGITKYAGELIVKNICKTDRMIVRPVFGFGNYPDDLHSALTKVIYTLFADKDNPLKVLLDKRIAKNYLRVENIAMCVLKLIQNNCWNHEVNVGENYTERKDWYTILEMLSEFDKQLYLKNITNIEFKPNEDYLHWHNINNSKLRHLIGDDIHYINFEEGIKMTVESVLENKNTTPYWL